MLKALYGLLRSALLFYKKLSSDLENMGFEINPYDPCVANKMVNGSQMTVTWHVDDLKISHKDEEELTKFILKLNGIYGNKLTVARKGSFVPRYAFRLLYTRYDTSRNDPVFKGNHR